MYTSTQIVHIQLTHSKDFTGTSCSVFPMAFNAKLGTTKTLQNDTLTHKVSIGHS